MNQTILITGASGFVGVHLCKELAKCGHEIIAVTHQNPIPDFLRDSVSESFRVDLSCEPDVSALTKKLSPYAVIHAAALANPAQCEAQKELSYLYNVTATRHLTAAFGQLPEKSQPVFLYFSSDMVFDGAVAPPGGFTEAMSPLPLSYYAQCKVQAEHLVRNAQKLLTKLILRTALVYGPRVPGRGGFLAWLEDSLIKKCPTSVFDDEYRTPIFVHDISHTIALLLKMPKEHFIFQNKLLHLAGSERVSRYEFGLSVCKIFGHDPELLVRTSRKNIESAEAQDKIQKHIVRPEDISLSVETLRTSIKFSPKNLEQGLLATKNFE